MEEEIPLKIIELADFLHSPSILSKRLQFKQITTESLPSDQSIKNKQDSDGLQFKDRQPGIVLLKQKALCSDGYSGEHSQKKELIVPKDVIIFADDIDRKKIGLVNKSTNQFSRHLLITSGAALQSLIPSLTNAKEWIIVCKLKYSKRYSKKSAIQGNVIVSLNINHPLVRYEILTGLDFLQQSFNEIKSAYIVIELSQLLSRWFKSYLQRTEQYPSLTNRIFYRYQLETCKCSVTLGKRQYYQNNLHYQIENTIQKLLYKSDIPMQIHIDLNSLPTIVYSIQLNNIFIYSINDEYKEVLKDIGNGLSLVSIQNLNPPEDKSHSIENKINNCLAIVQKEENAEDKYSVQEEEEEEEIKSINCDPLSYEVNEQEKILFENIWNNRMRIQIQHEQLMTKAARLFCFPSINSDSFSKQLNRQDHFS